MAIFHMSMKVCRTSGSAKVDYINREGKYSRSTKAEDLIYKSSHNLPEWAEDAKDFFSEMDKQEMSKKEKEGTAVESSDRKVKCREIEFALPAELNKEEQIQFAEEYCKELLGDNHVYTFAIHNNVGALSGEENPHVHLVFSDRLIEKDRLVERENFCRQRSGYKKDSRINGQDRNQWCFRAREKLAEKINLALKNKGINETVTEKSYKRLGLKVKPQVHLGVKASVSLGKNIATERVVKYIARFEERTTYKINEAVELSCASVEKRYGNVRSPVAVRSKNRAVAEAVQVASEKVCRKDKRALQAIFRNSKASLERKGIKVETDQPALQTNLQKTQQQVQQQSACAAAGDTPAAAQPVKKAKKQSALLTRRGRSSGYRR